MPSIAARAWADLRSAESLVTLACIALAVVSLVAVPIAVADPPDGLVVLVVFAVGLLVPMQYRQRWHVRYPDPGPALAWALAASVATAVVCVALSLAFVALAPAWPRAATGAALVLAFLGHVAAWRAVA